MSTNEHPPYGDASNRRPRYAHSTPHGVAARDIHQNTELTDSPEYRHLRSPKVLPRPPPLSSTQSQVAIPVQNYTRNISDTQDVPTLVNHSASYLTSSATRSEAFSHYLGPSVHSPSTSSQHVLTHRRQRPRTSNQVFTSSHGLNAPHGLPLPQSLPPAPSTAPRRSQPELEPLHSTLTDFASLSSNYLNMLAQKSDNTMPADNSFNTGSVPPEDLQSFDAEDLMGIVDVINGEYLVSSDSDEQDTEHRSASASTSTIPPTPETPELWTSPAFSNLGDDFLNTSPYSPDIDNLHTPLIGNDGDDMLSGMFYEDGPLFPPMDFVDYPYEKPAVPAPSFPDNMYTMTPESPALHDFSPSINPSAVYSKPPNDLSFLHPTQSTASASRSALGQLSPLPEIEGTSFPKVSETDQSNRRRSSATGTRKGVTPEALVPIDAPTQPRKYAMPSATSRKEVPSVFAKKRSRSTAFGEEDDEFNEPPLPPNATEKEMIEYKRRQNTVAARRSRKRKLQYQQDLEDKVERLQRERDVWKTRAVIFQDMLVANGVQFTPFQDSIED